MNKKELSSKIKTEWYRYSTQKILAFFEVGKNGLSRDQIKHNFAKFGPNILVDGKKRGFLNIFVHQFFSPLVYILVLAAFIVLFLGHYVDATIVFGIVFLNAVIGAFQEGRAEDTLLALKNFVKSYAVVIRDGKEKIIDDSLLVPGDIILLKDGSAIPADARIISANSLKVNQSVLTGESELVLKNAEPLFAFNLPVADQQNMIFRGSYVVSGLAQAVVINTGLNTIIGKISQKLNEIKIDVPLKKKIEELSKIIVWIVLFVSVTVFIFGFYTGRDLTELFITLVALAIASIPESLPVAVTLILTAGVWRLSRKNVLVKKLQAVEALGQATVIAVDKTGTITRNQMTVEKIFVNNRFINITGIGYDNKGNFLENGEIISNFKKDKDLDLIAKTAVFTAIADLKYKTTEKEWILERGDPTEASLIVLGKKYGYLKNELEEKYPKFLEIPFDFENKHHTTMNFMGLNKKMLFTAGSPEFVLKSCENIWQNGRVSKMSEEDFQKINTVMESITSEGYRVLALAINFKPPKELKNNCLPKMTFLGFVGITDSIREEVYFAIEKIKEANIKVVMITGDHLKTAEVIAQKVGIFKAGDIILTGEDIDSLDENALLEKLEKVTVFARVTPDHKMKIIELFKKRGEVIAMTGDGINDALSLTNADLGVSMGKNGTEVAREAADLVLLDDNLGSIVDATEEGRNIFWNIRKTVLFLIATHLAEILLIAGAILGGMPLPLIAVQIIWINLITDTFLIVALIFDPKEKNIMNIEFRSNNKHIIDSVMMVRILCMSIIITVITLTIFNIYLSAGIEKASTITLMTLTLFNILNIFNIRSHIHSIFTQSIFNNKYLLPIIIFVFLIQLFAIYVPFMQEFLKTAPLDLNDWLIIFTLSTSIIVIEEIRKYIHRIGLGIKNKVGIYSSTKHS
jgi:Ca2+-transporting ATPase